MSLNESEGRVGAKLGAEPVGMGWRCFFWLAAAYNFVIGVLGMLSPAADVDTRIIGLLVVGFGIIYMLVAIDPRRYAATLWAGIVGKVGVVALLGPAAIGPDGEQLMLAILGGDALFAIGFILFLFTHQDG